MERMQHLSHSMFKLSSVSSVMWLPKWRQTQALYCFSHFILLLLALLLQNEWQFSEAVGIRGSKWRIDATTASINPLKPCFLFCHVPLPNSASLKGRDGTMRPFDTPQSYTNAFKRISRDASCIGNTYQRKDCQFFMLSSSTQAALNAPLPLVPSAYTATTSVMEEPVDVLFSPNPQWANTSTPVAIQQCKLPICHPKRWKFTRTKQIATLGPSSFSESVIESFFLNGVDIFRINLSHGIWAEKSRVVQIVRKLEKKWKHPIAIMADLQGPKLRMGAFANESVYLADGQMFRFDEDPALGNTSRVYLPHAEIFQTLSPGNSVLLDDGKLRLKVLSSEKGVITCLVEQGGALSSYKGVNIPSAILPISALSQKDRKDALFAKTLGVDFIALSFVQLPQDILELRNLVGSDVDIVAKIEKPSAVANIDGIIAVSDGVMIGRGDLGVEMKPEKVPVVQKRLITKCRQAGKPVIVATQMLESMIRNSSPTRAEASDVATAIYDGADAVMLSGETAAGKFPEEAVKVQRRIIESVEKDPHYWDLRKVRVLESEDSAMDAISLAAKHVAESVCAKAIVSFTIRGDTVGRISASRPDAPIIAVTPSLFNARKLQLSWGVYPVVAADVKGEEIESIFQKGCDFAIKEGMVESSDDYLVVTAGIPSGKAGATNVLHVCKASSGLLQYPQN